MKTATKTYSPRPRDIVRRWYVLDGQGAVLGRLASEAAKLLRGKHKPIFAPHADVGDHVIVINARGVVLTGGKEGKKIYYRHSGYPGGIRAIEYSRLMSERPSRAVEKAIKGMLPKNRLGRQMFRKLSVYEGSEHPHQAQKPIVLTLGEVPKWEGLPKPKPPPAPPVDAGSEEAGPRRRTRVARRAAPAKAAGREASTSRRAAHPKAEAEKPAKAEKPGKAEKPSKPEQEKRGRSPRRRAEKKEP